jgi:uncharacterized protein YbaR (Trm112 family)/SAM-dependent methyltransferase
VRYALLSFLRCPECHDALACFVSRERATSISPFVAAEAARAPAAGQAFAPAPPFAAKTPLAARLTALGGPAAPSRNREAAVESGILVCGGCGRWFPILERLPELLPDHLRDAARDAALLDTLAPDLPSDVRAMLRAPGGSGTADAGVHYKRAEIGIASKVDDPAGFFGPGYSAPFNPGNTEFTLYLISLFANVVKLLGVSESAQRAVVLDSGCGYAWTTEWLAKSGLEAIGVDICRAYLEIGVRRMGDSHPHLVVADVENLPIADACADAVLAYESFHHIPDRARAMAGYARVLKDEAAVVLAEPGAAHETADVSVDMMQKFGILEKGMELTDVEAYAADLPFARPEQHYVMHASAAELEQGITLPSAWRHSIFHGNVFRIRKRGTGSTSSTSTSSTRSTSTGSTGSVSPPRTAGTSSTDSEAVPTDSERGAASFEELQALHERTTREWNAEVQRLASELHAVTLDLHAARAAAAIANRTVADMQRSAFWRARAIWVWISALFGSDRGGTPQERRP